MTTIPWVLGPLGHQGETWNPQTGCDWASEECDACYAMLMAPWLKGMGNPRYQNDGDPRTSAPGFGLTLHRDLLDVPRKRRKPTGWFVNSMSDLWHRQVPSEWLIEVFATMALCPQHRFYTLTKRASIMADWFRTPDLEAKVRAAAAVRANIDWLPFTLGPGHADSRHRYWPGWPLPNVWVGVSAGNQRAANTRIPHLCNTPAAIHWVSVEPYIGEIDLRTITVRQPCRACAGRGSCGVCVDGMVDKAALDQLDWIVVGGESGKGGRIRRMDPAWARDLRDQAHNVGAAYYFKQTGSRLAAEWGLQHPRGEDPNEWPADLRVREHPTAVAA
jgi:protein gp37